MVIDALILAIVGTLAILGLRRGFVLGLVDLAAIAVSLLVAARLYRGAIVPLVAQGVPREAVAPAAFVVVAGAVLAVASLTVTVLLRPIVRAPWPPPLRLLDAILGLLPGLLKGLALATVVAWPLLVSQGQFGLRPLFAGSRLAVPLVESGRAAFFDLVDRYGIDPRDFFAATARSGRG